VATPRVKPAANLGYFVFGYGPDTMMVLATTIVVLSGVYAFYRQRIRHREVAASAFGLSPDELAAMHRTLPIPPSRDSRS
jgi:hypothetical protein